jgi:hypothetical protein
VLISELQQGTATKQSNLLSAAVVKYVCSSSGCAWGPASRAHLFVLISELQQGTAPKQMLKADQAVVSTV